MIADSPWLTSETGLRAIRWLSLWYTQNLILATGLILLSALLSVLIFLYIYTEIYIILHTIPGTDLSIFPHTPPLNTSCMHTTEYKQVLAKNGTPPTVTEADPPDVIPLVRRPILAQSL